MSAIMLTSGYAQNRQQPAGDTAFDHGSRITHIATDSSTVQDLKALGLLWGFLKYYHPGVAKGQYNWDYELFRMIPKILNAENHSERDKIFVQWINTLGTLPGPEGKREDFSHAKIKPDLAWITSSHFSDGLSRLLLRIRNEKRGNENYYVRLARGVGNPVFPHENAYANMSSPDAGFRLLALFRYWNIIQYYYPYKNLFKEDWKNVLTRFIPEFIRADDSVSYTLTALKLIGEIRDTHANIWGNNPVLNRYFGLRSAIPELIFIDSQVVVKGFYNDEYGKETGLRHGDIITAINGRKTGELLKDYLPVTPASNYATQLRNIARNLLRTNDSLITVSYLRNGISGKETVKTYPLYELYQAYQKKDTCFRMVAPDIAYLYLGTIKSSYLPSIFKTIEKTKGLVIDLRCYPSEFVVFSLGKYLMPDARPFVRFSRGSIAHPGLFTMGGTLKVGGRNKHDYRGKVVILVNELTQSQAEYTTMAFRVAPRAMVAGSTTAGADGNVSAFHLPGGISTLISGIGIYYPDGRETQRIGIVPDVEARPTLAGVKEGRDEVLEKAIALIRE